MKPFIPGLFFLVFAGLGLWSSFDLNQSGDRSGALTSLVLGLILLALSLAAIVFAAKLHGKRKTTKPWLERSDWAANKISATQNRSSVAGLAAVGVTCIVGAIFLFRSDSGSGDIATLKWLALLFGAVFSSGSAYVWGLRNKFGKSFFTMDELPGVIGGNLAGTIVVSKKLPGAIESVHVKLSAWKMDSRRDGEITAQLLWESPEIVSVPITDEGFSRIRVRIPIPESLPASGSAAVKNRIFWKLEAQAGTEGLDYNVEFEVPISAADEDGFLKG